MLWTWRSGLARLQRLLPGAPTFRTSSLVEIGTDRTRVPCAGVINTGRVRSVPFGRLSRTETDERPSFTGSPEHVIAVPPSRVVGLLGLVDGITELVRRTKDRFVSLLNLHRLIGSGVAPLSRRPVLHLKDPESPKLDSVPLLHRPPNRCHEALYNGLRFNFGEASPLRNLINEIRFGHRLKKAKVTGVEKECHDVSSGERRRPFGDSEPAENLQALR